MAYFSNGSEGEAWEEKNCSVCPLGKSPCPVLYAHHAYNSDQLVGGERKGPLAEILALLIPQGDDNCAGDCVMRVLIQKKINIPKPSKGVVLLPGFKVEEG